MVALVRSGRNANDLAKEFEPTAQTINAWVRQADRDEGRREDGLTSRISCGSLILPTYQPGLAFCIYPLSWMPSPDVWLVGQWPHI